MNRYKKEELEQLILNDKLSYIKIGEIYGVSDNAIKKAAKRLGIDLPQRRKINPNEIKEKKIGYCINCGKEFIKYKEKSNKYCCIKCQHEYQHILHYKKIIEGDSSIMRPNYNLKYFKQDILSEQGNVCAICGCKPEHNNKPLVFILDHIDGHASNNKRDNLRMICPNCDSQLDTYKSKNKNSDRYYYRYL